MSARNWNSRSSSSSRQLAFALLVTLFPLCASSTLAQSAAGDKEYPKPERVVSGQSITSKADPVVVITIAPEFKYVGAVRWPLYDVADAELHIFVDAGPDKRVRRYYWVQFEQYLPTKPNARHDYSGSESRAKIGGWEWYVDADVAHYPYKASRPGSDGAHARAILLDHGYSFPPETGQLRLVYLTDPTNRKELMIIYEEDLAALEMKTADVESGTAPGHARLREKLVERAKAGIKIEPK